MPVTSREWPLSCGLMALVGVAIVAAVVRGIHGDVRMGQRVIEGLAGGNTAISRAIRWDRLRTLDVDVGAAYRRLPNDAERRAYEHSFIAQFAAGFRRAQGDAKAFTGWRVEGHQNGQTLVAVDYPPHHKTLLLTFGAGRKLEGLQWQ